jgi:hypothetical protein
MTSAPQIHLSDVPAVYAGPEGQLRQLLMDKQIRIGGLPSATELATCADLVAGKIIQGLIVAQKD